LAYTLGFAAHILTLKHDVVFLGAYLADDCFTMSPTFGVMAEVTMVVEAAATSRWGAPASPDRFHQCRAPLLTACMHQSVVVLMEDTDSIFKVQELGHGLT
jgi:hypothetical protein